LSTVVAYMKLERVELLCEPSPPWTCSPYKTQQELKQVTVNTRNTRKRFEQEWPRIKNMFFPLFKDDSLVQNEDVFTESFASSLCPYKYTLERKKKHSKLEFSQLDFWVI